MRLAWFRVALPVGAVLGSAVAAPRAGKVIRVERHKPGFSGHPRYCSIQPSDGFGSCTGSHAPEVGDTMIAVDRDRVLGTIRVTSVQPYNDGCAETYQWMIQTAVESGDFGTARNIMLGLSDVHVDHRSGRLVDVDKSPTGHSWGTDQVFAVDNDGDGNPEIEFIDYACDDAGSASTSNATSRCQEVWAIKSGRSLERLRQERFRSCY